MNNDNCDNMSLDPNLNVSGELKQNKVHILEIVYKCKM